MGFPFVGFEVVVGYPILGSTTGGFDGFLVLVDGLSDGFLVLLVGS